VGNVKCSIRYIFLMENYKNINFSTAYQLPLLNPTCQVIFKIKNEKNNYAQQLSVNKEYKYKLTSTVTHCKKETKILGSSSLIVFVVYKIRKFRGVLVFLFEFSLLICAYYIFNSSEKKHVDDR
jgi:hypothetical protein